MEISSGTNIGEQIPTDEENMPVSLEVQKRCKGLSESGLSESGTSCDVDNNECFFYYFPPFIWEQILLRLPFKSIFRMRCVCKSWLSLTLMPSFVRSHCLLAQQRLSSFALDPPWTLLYSYTCGQQFKLIPEERKLSHLCSSDHKSLQFSVLLSTARSQFDIVAENVGLLLLRRSQMQDGNYFVCNPITKKVVALPPIPCPDRAFQTGGEDHPAIHRTFISGVTFRRSPGLIVTVQDDLFTRYKVVVPIGSDKKDVVPAARFFVFCSQHGKWTDEIRIPIHHSPIYLACLCFSMPVTLNASIYWPDYRGGLLLAYQAIGNNGEACANMIRLPRVYTGQNQSSMCGSSGGNLRYLGVSSLDGRVMVEVWELEDSNSGNWSVKHTSDWSNVWSEDETLCKKLQEASSSPRSRFVPAALHPFDPDVIYLHDRECIVSYNLQRRRLDIVCDPRPEFLGICWWDMMPFVLPVWPTSIPGLISGFVYLMT